MEEPTFRHSYDVKKKKAKGIFSLSQNQRRKQMLKKQREKTESKLEKMRQALVAECEEEKLTNEMTDINETSSDQMMIEKPKKKERNLLMNHEILEEIPDDFVDEWVCMPIPEGQRCFVASGNQQTLAKAANGELLHKFPSFLPNGSHASFDTKKSYCIFDCIFSQNDNTFYILDMMCWKGHLYYECDSQFRFFFLQSKISEISYVTEISSQNPYRFIPLPTFCCTKEGISLASNANSIGFLPNFLSFYNKNTHYTTDESNPLVSDVTMDKVPSLLNSELLL